MNASSTWYTAIQANQAHSVANPRVMPQRTGLMTDGSYPAVARSRPGGRIRIYARPQEDRPLPPRSPGGQRLLGGGDGHHPDGRGHPAGAQPRLLSRRRSGPLAPRAVDERAGAQPRRHRRGAVRRAAPAAPRLRGLGGAPPPSPPRLGGLLAPQREGLQPHRGLPPAGPGGRRLSASY